VVAEHAGSLTDVTRGVVTDRAPFSCPHAPATPGTPHPAPGTRRLDGRHGIPRRAIPPGTSTPAPRVETVGTASHDWATRRAPAPGDQTADTAFIGGVADAAGGFRPTQRQARVAPVIGSVARIAGTTTAGPAHLPTTSSLAGPQPTGSTAAPKAPRTVATPRYPATQPATPHADLGDLAESR